MQELKPIKKRNLTSQVMDSLKEYVASNELAAGDRLPSERQLTESLGVSKTILREALKSLQAVGILEINAGNGIFVAGEGCLPLVEHLSFSLLRSPRDSEHLKRTRAAIEVGALSDVMANITNEDLFLLQRNCDRLELVNTAEDYVAVELEFHKGIVATSRNPLLTELSAILNVFFARVVPIVVAERIPGERTVDARNHRAILEALETRDLWLAQSRVRRHILGSSLGDQPVREVMPGNTSS